MAAKSPLEMAAQSLVEISHMQRESIDQMATAQKEGFAKIDTILGTLAEHQTALTASVNKLSDRVDNLAMVQQSQQIITEQLLALASHLAGKAAKLLAKNWAIGFGRIGK